MGEKFWGRVGGLVRVIGFSVRVRVRVTIVRVLGFPSQPGSLGGSSSGVVVPTTYFTVS